ncbi:dynein-related subfamily AAA family protein [Halanaerobium saccharolyticum]|uniref:Dynein-related subfamily AAA family protein n=1 Tax=Halanaerobium saccharolyticum TaxID=43595 RepID=A0A4V3CFS6_9FIRM|nr:AAA family ATPase [Halanaerobium saccharolyticum]TDO95012.1 dynein-related subfamily AAA family protein [Halanaerobium saccharolyticum]
MADNDRRIYLIIGEKTNFNRTIKSSVDINELYEKNMISEATYNDLISIYPDAKMKCWGFPDNKNKDNVWARMNEDDLCLMYNDDQIVMSGIFKYRFHNQEVAEYIWESDGVPFEYIFCLDDVHILDIPSEKILIEEFGYKKSFIMGANPLANSRLEKVLDKYGSIDNFRKEIEKENRTDILHSSNSWRILSENIFLKIIDKSVLHNNGTGIPKDIIKYFEIEDIAEGGNREIIFNYNDEEYYARFEHISLDRYRIMWRQDFANILKDELSFWHQKFEEDSSYGSDQERPKLKFFKKSSNKYEIELIKGEETDITYDKFDPNIWWVNQGQTMEAEKNEGILWAPIKSKGGTTQYHWETMTEVKLGDIILHYANGSLRYVSQVKEEAVKSEKPASMEADDWNREGRLIKTDYYKLEPEVSLDQFNQEIVELDIEKGPINKLGGVNQGYLFYFNKKALTIIQNKAKETNWPEFALLEEDPMIAESDKLTTKEKLNQIKTYIKAQGYTYPDKLIENFYLSLKTKPFVLLAGISGTGKTKLVELFARAIGCPSDNDRFKLISVKPDWNDSADLLGYSNIRGDFQPGPILETIKKAAADPANPYLVCLDEMNLARVEYYFSDFLSKMETRHYDGDQIKTDRLLNENDFDPNDKNNSKTKYSNLHIPDNLYLIGTVNMDETTHPFSKKVLDRANTIEFNQIDLTAFLKEDYSVQAQSLKVNNQFLKTEYLNLKDLLPAKKDEVRRITEELERLNQILKKANLQVGYRIRDEINFYVVEALDKELLAENTAFDKEILQKVLPRIQGSSAVIKEILLELFDFFSGASFSKENGQLSAKIWNYYQAEKEDFKYPESAEKITYMLRKFEEDGFTSYWL